MHQGWERGQKRWKEEDLRPPELPWRAAQAEADDVRIPNSKYSVCNLDVEHVAFTPV
jgi:hypothetical protein